MVKLLIEYDTGTVREWVFDNWEHGVEAVKTAVAGGFEFNKLGPYGGIGHRRATWAMKAKIIAIDLMEAADSPTAPPPESKTHGRRNRGKKAGRRSTAPSPSGTGHAAAQLASVRPR